MEIVVVALIAGVLGPGVLAYITGRQRRDEKREDWARQDAVAAQAAEAAALLLENQTLTLEATEEVARVAQESRVDVSEQLKEIHTLVNSDMTAALAVGLEQMTLLLAAQKDIIELHHLAGSALSIERAAELEATELRITEAQKIIAERSEKQRIAEKGTP